MEKRVNKLLSSVALVMFIITAVSTPVIASNEASNAPSKYKARNTANGLEIIADLLVIRPALLTGTIAGSCGYIITLPFTLMGKNAKYAGKKLVVEPALWTFTYPLGSY